MDDTAKRRADENTENAINAAGIEDFRDTYRERLRWLKENRPAQFASALAHYNEVLVPNIANGGDPLQEWLDYGKRLGELTGPGQLFRVDETGRADSFDGDQTGLVLHLPDDTGVPAFALLVPREVSDAQRATLELLVKR